MLKVYLNSPASRVTIHHDSACSQIQKNRKRGQRMRHINRATVAAELRSFDRGAYQFSANPAGNDMWLEIDLGSEAEEQKVLNHILLALGRRYKRIRQAVPSVHC